MTHLRFLILCLLSMLSMASAAEPWDSDSIESIFKGRILDPIEGVWQFPADGATLLICKSTASTFSIFLLESPQLDLKPGIQIGTATVTPKDGHYDVRLDSKQTGNKRLNKSTMVASVLSNGNLLLKPYSEGLKLSASHSIKIPLPKWIPYYLRVSIKDQSAPDGLVGAEKVFPIDKSKLKPCL